MYLGGKSEQSQLELNGASSHLRLLALYNVIHEPGDYNLRFIFRWYSKTFATPLHVVEALPLHDVLIHYFECHYEGLNDSELEDEIRRLTMSTEKLARLKREEDAADADAYEYGRIAEQEEKAKQAPVAPVEKPVPENKPEPKAPLIEGFSLNFEDLDLGIPDSPSFGPKG
jgi:hypothetical protein